MSNNNDNATTFETRLISCLASISIPFNTYSTHQIAIESRKILKLSMEKDIIELLVVLEPSRRKSKSDNGTYTDWAVRNICQEDADAMLADCELKKFIHEDIPDESTRPGTMRVRIFETVSAFICQNNVIMYDV